MRRNMFSHGFVKKHEKRFFEWMHSKPQGPSCKRYSARIETVARAKAIRIHLKNAVEKSSKNTTYIQSV